MQFGQNRIPLNMSNAALVFQFFSHQSGLAAIFFLHALIHYYTLLSKEVNHIFVVIQYGAIQQQYYTRCGCESFNKLYRK